MKINNKLFFDKILVFGFLAIGILLIFQMNSVYLQKSAEKQIKDKQIRLMDIKKEQVNKLPYDPERKKRVVDIEISDDQIKPETINVSLGEEIIINTYVPEGYHNLNIEFYNLKTKNLATGKTVVTNFIATKSGEFRIFSNTNKYNFSEPEGILNIIKDEKSY